MTGYKQLIVLLFIGLLMTTILVPGSAAPLDKQQNTEPALSQAENHEQNSRFTSIEPADDGMVEILIMLKEKADTENAALEIIRQQRPLNKTAPGFNQDLKDDIAIAVVDTLRVTARRTQAPLLQYLEAERLAGRVLEYKSYYIVNLVFARLATELIDEIAVRPEVDSILPNETIQLSEPIKQTEPLTTGNIEWNISQVNAPDVWAKGFDGSGVVIGIIDTGVDLGHEALIHKYRGYDPGNNHSHAYNWFDPFYNRAYPDDRYGHGTHCMGTVLGSDKKGENMIGVAPGAQWIAARGFDDKGYTDVASLLASAEYLLAPTPNPDGSGDGDPTKAPDIINNSWGAGPGVNEWFMEMVQAWRDAGILPVFAAGNSGPDPSSIVVPANYPNTLSVAAIDSDNNLADFSSRGPAPYPDPDNLQPHISAPGVGIRSAIPGNSYDFWCGTSMAASHISGVGALLLEACPDLTVYQLERIMLDTAKPLFDSTYTDSPNFGFGYGLVDAFAAIPTFINTKPAFTDVTQGMQFFGYIEAIFAEGITTGYDDGTYRPDEPVTRGQLAAFLARGLKLEDAGDPDNPSFSDVNPNMQFFGYIEKIYAEGITTGYGDGMYRPRDTVTRGQMAAFLARALELPEAGDPNNPSFSDVSPGMQFFPYIEAIYSEGITTGYDDGTYRPDKPVTRGQMAAFLARALDLHN